MAKLDEISQAIGKLQAGMDSLNDKFDNLPCKGEGIKLTKIDERLSKVEGKITVISAISGFVGSVLYAVVSWFLTKNKLF